MSIEKGIRTYRGSCHCGAVRYEVDFDLSEGTGRCNCSICWKTGWWGRLVKPAQFRLISGQKHIVTLPRNPLSEHPRCAICGVESFSHGNVPEIGGEFYSVNVRCLDNVDLDGVPVNYHDGLHNTWATMDIQPWRNPFKEAAYAGAFQPSAHTHAHAG